MATTMYGEIKSIKKKKPYGGSDSTHPNVIYVWSENLPEEVVN